MEQHCISYGEKQIYYVLRHSNRKTLAISVYPDLAVEVVAPRGASHDAIEERVRRRIRWVLRQQSYFSQFLPRRTERKYISGETHLYLGKQYRLKVEHDIRQIVKLSRGAITILTYKPECEATNKKLVLQWYAQKAENKLSERFEEVYSKYTKLGIEKPSLQLKKLHKRWGSLSPNGILLLNRELIQAPPECIDYVIAHELCHMKHPNHSRPFYELLDKVMPDWGARKHKLEFMLA